MKNYLSGRRLFIKIFLWFCLTGMLIGLIFFLSPLIIQPDYLSSGWRTITATALVIYGQTAADLYEREGSESLKKYLERIEAESQIKGFLLDAGKTNLSGGDLPNNFETLLKRDLIKNELQFELKDFTILSSLKISSQTNQYIFLCEMPRKISYSFFAVEPGVRFLRITLLILSSLLVCFWLTRYLTEPIVKLNNAAMQISKGDLTTRIGSIFGKRNDELTNLSQTFDQMAEQLENLIKSQNRLLGDISHELRSPLARLCVAASLAREGADKTEVEESLEVIDREAANLNEMIDQLLTLTKLESLNQKASFTKFEIASLMREVVSDVRFETARTNRTIKIKKLDECSFQGERKLLRSAIENIVRNAVKYTSEFTSVEIEGSKKEEGIKSSFVIKVRDYGCGIPENELKNVFQPFYRVADDRDRSSGGTGLGLAIALRAVKLHGGTIEAFNAKDGGLIVIFSLPLKS